MVIETKYNIGDKVFFISRRSVRESTVKRVSAEVDKDNVKITYNVGWIDVADSGFYEEQYLFPTKEELIASL